MRQSSSDRLGGRPNQTSSVVEPCPSGSVAAALIVSSTEDAAHVAHVVLLLLEVEGDRPLRAALRADVRVAPPLDDRLVDPHHLCTRHDGGYLHRRRRR